MMSGWIDAVSAFIVANRAWAAPVFGLVAFGESLAFLGIIIPATPILFLMGTLVGSGRLDAGPVLAWAMAGAIAGYGLSWWAGRRAGNAVLRHPLLARHRRGVARARLFFRRWGGPALIFGRYVLGPFQSMLPMIAGVAMMDARRFHAWNVVSGVTWVLICLTPGYLATRGLTLFGVGASGQSWLIASATAVSVGAVAVAVLVPTLRRLRKRPN